MIREVNDLVLQIVEGFKTKSWPVYQASRGKEISYFSKDSYLKIKIYTFLYIFYSSFLGRKGGFLHNYAMLEASTSNQSNTDTDHTTTPIKVTPPTPGRGKSQSMKVKSSRSGSLSATGTLKKNTNNSGVNRYY